MPLACSLTSSIPINFKNMIYAHVSVPSGFDKHTTSHISCVITIGSQEDELHLPALSHTQHLFYLRPAESPGMLTAKPFPGLADGHVHVQFSWTYCSIAGLPSALLCQLIPKGVFAESNDPFWQPSHTAATPLIFREMPCRLKGSIEPCRVPFTKC